MQNYSLHSFAKISILGAVLSCGTAPQVQSPLPTTSPVELKSLPWSVQKSNRAITYQKIAEFDQALATRGKSLTQQDLKLYDELLKTYVELKQAGMGHIKIPAKTKIKLVVPSFCLNSNKAAPSSRERYQWRTNETGIPYFKEILSLFTANEISGAEAQTLLWGLRSRSHWESFSPRHKRILLKIDSSAPIKLPSRLKSSAKDYLKDYLTQQVPLLDDALSTASEMTEKYIHYKDFAERIESIIPKTTLDLTSPEITAIPGTSLYAETKSNSYTSQEITVYNPTNEAQDLDLSNYYLKPTREEVQPIAVGAPLNKDMQALFNKLKDVLLTKMGRMGLHR